MQTRIPPASKLLLCLLLIPCLCFSVQAQTNAVSTRFSRGTGSDPTYQSFVIPLDFEKGVSAAPSLVTTLAALGKSRLYHLDATNAASQFYVTNRIPITNAVAAFGSKYAGSPLYIGQNYSFGLYAGNPDDSLQSRTNAFLITTTDRTSGRFLGGWVVTLPIPYDSTSWNSLLSAGNLETITVPGLVTEFSFVVGLPWDTRTGAGAIQLKHLPSAGAATNEYTIWVQGLVDKGPIVESADFTAYWSPLYTLDFDAPPATQAPFVSQPQFQGKPLPPAYEGKSLTELLATQAIVTNAVTGSPTNYLDLADPSPELRQHPILDQFVSDMGSNALALAAYVQNNIGLCDAMAYNNTTNLPDLSVNLGGVNRGALGVFMEGQGSPMEQCSLLVYLLRRAGVPAAYIFAPNDGVQMLDARLSMLLRMQIVGAVNQNGQLYTTNSLISVNYPWVAAYINGQWTHLFPWIKDTQVTEGLNLYDYMPAGYQNGNQWTRHYLTGDTNILALSTETDTAGVLFLKHLQNSLLLNAPGISVDDIGTKAFDRQVQFAQWSDFPTPFAVTNGAVNTVRDLTSITNIFPSYTNIFDTVSVQVYSAGATNKSLFTKDLRMADLSNRKFLIRHQTNGVNYDCYLTLAAYRPSLTNVLAK